MQCGVVTGTGADMLSHCDEKHSEMMWRECSSCPQRDGKLAVAFVYSFVLPCLCESTYVCVCVCILVGCSLGALVIVCAFCLAFKPVSLCTQSVWFRFCFVFDVAVAKAISERVCSEASQTLNQPRCHPTRLLSQCHQITIMCCFCGCRSVFDVTRKVM